LGNGSGAFNVVVNVNSSDGNYLNYRPYLADFNGDGTTDILWDNEDQYGRSQGYRIIWMGNGDGAFNVVVNVNSSDGNYINYRPYLADFNGDGKTDILWDNEDQYGRSQGYRIIWLGNGSGAFNVVVNVNSSDGNYIDYRPYLADFNGDGKTDILWDKEDQYGRSAGYRILWKSDGLGSDLLTAITDGLGVRTSVTYGPMTNNALYTKGTSATYPTMDLQAAIYAVSQVDAGNGIGGNYSSTYNYGGAQADLEGRGFLGFHQMVVTDAQTGIKSVTNYRQDYPYTGLAASKTKTLGALTLNQTTNTYGATSLGGTRYFVSLGSSVESSFDLDGSAIPPVTTSYAYDAYGNPTTVTVSTADGYSKTTANTYTNDTTNWFLGRLTRATVTSTTP